MLAESLAFAMVGGKRPWEVGRAAVGGGQVAVGGGWESRWAVGWGSCAGNCSRAVRGARWAVGCERWAIGGGLWAVGEGRWARRAVAHVMQVVMPVAHESSRMR
eukprot:1280750-Prymnesium_polylepis.1